MDYNLESVSPSFDIFKEEVNQKINGLTKEWWDKIEVHLHGGIYQGQVEYGIIDVDGEEDISKIVTLTAIIGYSYLRADWEEGAKLSHYIDDIHNRFLPVNFRLPLEDGLFNRRNFINFIDILLKHAEQTEIYRSSLDIDVDGATLKHQSSDAKDRWDRVENDDGTVQWVFNEDYYREGQWPYTGLSGFNVKIYEDPLEVLMSVAGPDMSGYGTIVESVQTLSERRHFINLVILLKEFVTKAYQLESEELDYKEMDYQVALKVVEEERQKDLIEKQPFGLFKLNDIFQNIFDGPSRSGGNDSIKEYFNHWSEKATSIDAVKDGVRESLCGPSAYTNVRNSYCPNINKLFQLPDVYGAWWTIILIIHLILYEKQQVFKAKIWKKIYSELRNFRNVSNEVIAEHYQEIVDLISELWSIMFAWHNLYGRIYSKHMNALSKRDHEVHGSTRFDQKMKSTELSFWEIYLNLRFETSKYKDDLDLSPDPTTFKKVFARAEVLRKQLEPSFSNPPLIVMPHLHTDLDGPQAISPERLEKFKSNDELIYENEKEFIYQLRRVEELRSELDLMAREDYFNAQSKPEYQDAMNELGKHKKSASWMQQFLIDLVNSPEIHNLVLYYEALIEDDEVGTDQLPFIREFKEKYGDDLSFFYDFEEVENRMIANLDSINNEGLPNFTVENMIETLRKEGNIDRILFINDDIKDSKDEVVPETEYAKYWPERKRFLDNILKKIHTEEEELEPDLSDLMKESQAPYDPLQQNWLSGYTDLDNPMDELKSNVLKERMGAYPTATLQGKVGIQAAQRAKRAIDFKESSKAFHKEKDKEKKELQKQRLIKSTKALTEYRDKPLKRTPTRQRSTVPRAVGVLSNKRLWKRNGIGKDKYEDYFMKNQFWSAGRDRWGMNYLEDAPQVFLDAVDLEGTPEEQLLAYKRAFQIIDLDVPLGDDEVVAAFIEEVQDIERRGSNGEEVRMVVLDRENNPMFDRDDQRKPAEAYLGSNMYRLPSNYGTLRFNSLKDIANYELPVIIGKTLDGEDVYQMKPFLTLYNEPKDFRVSQYSRLGGGCKKGKVRTKKKIRY